MAKWCTIESDPAVFTELIAAMGVQRVSVDEIYSLDESMTNKSYGLIFLFKWRSEVDSRSVTNDASTEEIFFAKQMVQNACATQAILSVLMNTEDIELGDQLSGLKAFTMALDSESRGISIGSCDFIRTAHNSFARAEPFLQDDDEDSKRSSSESEDVFHFIAYIPHKGSVYE